MKTDVEVRAFAALAALVVLGVVAVTVFGVNERVEVKDNEIEAVVSFSEEEFNAAHVGDIRDCIVCGKKWQGLLCLDGYNYGECVGCQILRDSAQKLFDASNAAAADGLKE